VASCSAISAENAACFVQILQVVQSGSLAGHRAPLEPFIPWVSASRMLFHLFIPPQHLDQRSRCCYRISPSRTICNPQHGAPATNSPHQSADYHGANKNTFSYGQSKCYPFPPIPPARFQFAEHHPKNTSPPPRPGRRKGKKRPERIDDPFGPCASTSSAPRFKTGHRLPWAVAPERNRRHSPDWNRCTRLRRRWSAVKAFSSPGR